MSRALWFLVFFFSLSRGRGRRSSRITMRITCAFAEKTSRQDHEEEDAAFLYKEMVSNHETVTDLARRQQKEQEEDRATQNP